MSVPYKQELPPVGGYEPIKFKRNLPIRGPSGSLIMSGVFVTCLYGFYRYGQGNLEKRELKRENMWSRIHLVPILTAENDRDQFRRNRAQLDREREIMKDDPDWVVGQSVYNTKFSFNLSILIIYFFIFSWGDWFTDHLTLLYHFICFPVTGIPLLRHIHLYFLNAHLYPIRPLKLYGTPLCYLTCLYRSRSQNLTGNTFPQQLFHYNHILRSTKTVNTQTHTNIFPNIMYNCFPLALL
ncbi:hypothetical protein MJO29_002595 [Puccinia striiformis f. sp. tritici]|nr:hypothetical protein MJO29_002595 [Puccinia striiformis f. sp. tritici]